MIKLKNVIGALTFLFASSLMLRAMRWVTDDKGRTVLLDTMINAGIAAQKTKDAWKTISNF